MSEGIAALANRIMNAELVDPDVTPAPREERARSRLIRMSSTLTIRPKNWLVKGVLGRGELSVVFAPSGGGKSFVALDLAARISTGDGWFGHSVEPASVLYVAGEGATGFQHRMVAWAREMNVVDADFHMLPAAVDLFSENSHGRAEIDIEVAEIRRQTKSNVGLIVLDTLSRMMPGGVDSDPRDMKMFLNQVEKLRLQTGAHIMLVHHTGKEKDRGMRGSSMLRDYADTVFEVKPPEDDGSHIIKIDKQKDGQDGVTYKCDIHTVTLDIDSDGDAITTCVVRHLGPGENTGNLSRNSYAGIAKDALEEAILSDGVSGSVTPPDGNVTTTVTLDAWESHFRVLVESRIKGGFPSSDARRQAWSRAKKTLLSKGLVAMEGAFAWKP